MWGLLRTRRWLSFTATVLVAIIAFAFLSRWQWYRAQEEDAKASEVSGASAASTVDLQSLPVDQALPAEYRTVSLQGDLQCDRGYLVRNKPLNGSTGFWVACPLRTADGTWAWINRGWLAASGAASAGVAMPPAPGGEVTVTGHLRHPQEGPATSPPDLPPGQVVALDTDALASMAHLDGRIYEPYIDATVMTPAEPAGLQPLPLPTRDSAQNYSYAGQWLLFALIAIAGWFYFLRREAREDALSQSQGEPFIPPGDRRTGSGKGPSTSRPKP